MFGNTIAEIYTMIGSPGWWFATIFVALLVNIASAYIYDATKPYGSATAKALLWALVLIQGFLFFLSCLYLKPTNYQAQNMLPILGIVAPLVIFVECYLLRQFQFVMVVSFVVVFSLAVFIELQINPPPMINAEWLARQYFYSMWSTGFVTVIWGNIIRWRVMRAHRRQRLK